MNKETVNQTAYLIESLVNFLALVLIACSFIKRDWLGFQDVDGRTVIAIRKEGTEADVFIDYIKKQMAHGTHG